MRRARAGGGRSGSQTLAGADQCPGQGWKGRERAQATPSRVWEEVRCREQAGERDSLPGPFLLLPSPGTGGSSPRPVPPGLRLRAWLLPQQPPPPSPPNPRQRDRAGVLTSALTSASSAAASRPRQLRSTSSSGSSRGRAAFSRSPSRLLAQTRRPGALRSLPMLSAPSRAPSAAHGARPLVGAGSPHAARKLATLPGSPPSGRAADIPVPVPGAA